MLRVSVVSAENDLDGLREEWDDLLSRSRSASIFQTWEWITVSWQYFGQRKRLLVLCVRDGERLVGLAPLELTSMYLSPLRRLQFIGTGVSDYLDFVLDADSEDAVLAAIDSWLADNHECWDLLDLQNIPENSSTKRPWNGSRLRRELLRQEICPYLPLPESWDEMHSSFGKKMRYNLGYYERLMKRNFNVHLDALSAHELDEGMSAFFHLHTQRWRKRFLPGMLTGERKQKFHRDIAWLAHKKGWLRLHGLRLDGKLQSILYCFTFNDRGYYYLGGFEPELSKYSPGTVLTGYAIRDAIERGCTEFDFLRGNEPYKSRWTQHGRTNFRLVVKKETSRSRIAAAVCRLEQRIEHRVKHELHKRIGAG